jgi:hypothetical protein
VHTLHYIDPLAPGAQTRDVVLAVREYFICPGLHATRPDIFEIGSIASRKERRGRSSRT